MIKPLLSLILLAGFSLSAKAQSPQHSCGFDHWLHHVKQNDADRARVLNDRYANWIEQSRELGQLRDDEIYEVPVVFHVVHNTDEQNLPDSVIHSQLEVLNEDYRRLNENASETREEFLPVAADVGIEFVLAELDPEGNPTDGIVRVETDREGFELDLFSQENTLDEVKFSASGGSDAWDTEHYINIWVCNIEAGGLGQIFGLAYPPEGTPNWPEGSFATSPDVAGVVVQYTVVGRNNPHNDLDGVDGNDQGRTLVHELGHYFGLRHIWGDALPFFGDGCDEDDGLTDTPNAAAADNFLCNLEANTCEDEPVDFPDMIENYMDYSPDACMNLFTQEQADMMRFVLTELRPGLLNSDAVSVQESGIENQLSIFPNPTKDLLNIHLSGETPIEFVEVLDYTGRVLRQQNQIHENRLVVPVENLRPGSYFLRISSESGQAVKKFIRL